MIRPLLGEPPISVFMVTVGLASILVGLVEMIWTADQRRLPDFMPTQADHGGRCFPGAQGVLGRDDCRDASLLPCCWCSASGAAAWRCVPRPPTRPPPTPWASTCRACSRWPGWSPPCSRPLSGIIVGSIGGISSTMGVFGLSVLVVVIVGGLDSVLGALVGGSVHWPGGSAGRRFPGRRVQAAGHLHRAGGDPDDPALRPVRHPRDRETLDMRPHAHHFVYSLPPEGVLASLGAARREA